jgi:hypothetical protein
MPSAFPCALTRPRSQAQGNRFATVKAEFGQGGARVSYEADPGAQQQQQQQQHQQQSRAEVAIHPTHPLPAPDFLLLSRPALQLHFFLTRVLPHVRACNAAASTLGAGACAGRVCRAGGGAGWGAGDGAGPLPRQVRHQPRRDRQVPSRRATGGGGREREMEWE